MSLEFPPARLPLDKLVGRRCRFYTPGSNDPSIAWLRRIITTPEGVPVYFVVGSTSDSSLGADHEFIILAGTGLEIEPTGTN